MKPSFFRRRIYRGGKSAPLWFYAAAVLMALPFFVIFGLFYNLFKALRGTWRGTKAMIRDITKELKDAR